MVELLGVEDGAGGAAVGGDAAVEAAAVAEVGEVEGGVEGDGATEVALGECLSAVGHWFEKGSGGGGEHEGEFAFGGVVAVDGVFDGTQVGGLAVGEPGLGVEPVGEGVSHVC